VQREKFVAGDYIFVNCQMDELDGNDGDIAMKEDAAKFSVARIIEIRGVSQDDIWIRVAWYYRADELPGGPKPYHGKYEVVRTILEDIISIETVAGSCTVIQWDENDDSQRCLDVLFWRQTLMGRNLSVMTSDFLMLNVSETKIVLSLQKAIQSRRNHVLL
jgi:hypothetical protein